MSKYIPVQFADLRWISRLAVDATLGVTDIVEGMHVNITRLPGIFGEHHVGSTRGISGLVYRSVRGVTRVVGRGLDVGLGLITPLVPSGNSTPAREALIAQANGVLGDHLVATGNPLAIPMRFRHHGRPLTLEAEQISATLSKVTPKILVLLHGLCMNDLQWTRKLHNHGSALASLGYTPVYLHYNTGQHISTNGQQFSALLDELLAAWPVPVEEIVLLGHSMGGLVSRSACYYAAQGEHAWLGKLKKMVFLGSPHHGAAAERVGNMVDRTLIVSPYTASLAKLGKLRSAGITDLRFGLITDRDRRSGDRFAHARDEREPVPLPAHVACYAIGATLSKTLDVDFAKLASDGIVSLSSALGRHETGEKDLGVPLERQWIVPAANHFDLLSDKRVCERLKGWLA